MIPSQVLNLSLRKQIGNKRISRSFNGMFARERDKEGICLFKCVHVRFHSDLFPILRFSDYGGCPPYRRSLSMRLLGFLRSTTLHVLVEGAGNHADMRLFFHP